jgi:peptidoglycan hydrolase-like protein with peptidoglycan-binding domain
LGDEGPEVLEIQTLLGFSQSGKTGKYGTTTEAAVKAFQVQNNIQSNGRVGPDTYAALTKPKSSTPLIDQHRMDHERAGAFCGIATLMMTLQGNGKNVNPQSRNELDQFSQGIYIPGNGSSGSAMASRMREYGLKDTQFTTGGTVSSLVSVLAKGKPVPMGVVSLSGKVVEMKKPSARYPDLKVGDTHYHRFGDSGHWVTVVSFEGDPKRPSYFYVNDPDTSAKLKMTRNELEESAAAGEGIWMIGY